MKKDEYIAKYGIKAYRRKCQQDGKKGKAIYLAGSSEEGFVWKLRVEVCENTKVFCGHFAAYGENVKRKCKIRAKDKQFFYKRLGKLYLDKYEIDHDWDNGGRVTLKTPKEHRNCHFGKSNQVDWIEEEEWLQEEK